MSAAPGLSAAQGAAPRAPWRFWVLVGGLSALLLAAIILGVAIGAVPIPPERVVGILAARFLPTAVTVDWSPAEAQIVWVFRLPRVLLAVIVGGALAVSGAALQALVRNPLADPFLFGISSGASLAAVMALTLGAAAVGGLSLSAAAFVGALLTTLTVFVLAQRQGRVAPLRLVLAGVALSFALSSATSFLVMRAAAVGDGNAAAVVLNWLSGSLGGAKWDHLGLPAVVLVTTIGVLMAQARPLNALLLGEEAAIGLGLNLQQLRLQLFLLTSLLVGTVVAISGAIGFVGLLIPHLVRMAVGVDHRRVLPLTALLGGVYLVFADLIGRISLAPAELPVGLVTSAVGGPFFLWLMSREQKPGGEHG